jgi:hypothetical protein
MYSLYKMHRNVLQGDDYADVYALPLKLLGMWISAKIGIPEPQKAFQPKLLIVLFHVLFVCKCVLYYCHQVSTWPQLTYQ